MLTVCNFQMKQVTKIRIPEYRVQKLDKNLTDNHNLYELNSALGLVL